MKRKIYELLSSAKQGLFALALTVFLGTAYSQVTTFNFTGNMQTMNLSQAGSYKIECWGADGGLGNINSGAVPNSQIAGGVGGYSSGTITIGSPTTWYINVGGRGADGFLNATAPGGYNGGGNGSVASTHRGGGGGGATHVATAMGVLSSLSGNQAAVIIVGGGGGGGGNQSIGGEGGGLNGVQPPNSTQFGLRTAGGGGSQSTGGVCFSLGSGAGFGQGGFSTQNLAGGGGGGWYGGCTGDNSTGGGGGSGYIGGLNTGTTVSVTQPGFIPNPDVIGNGYVKITRLCNISLNATSNPICIGQSLTLSTDAVSGITWSGSGSTANSIVVTPNATTSYTVVGTSTANCQTSSIITITVNPLPVLAAIVTPTTLCVGKTATITASGAATYTWNGGPTGSSLMVNPGVTTTYNLSGASQFGCLNSGTVAVNVNTNNISVPSAVTVCKGNPIDLIATGAVTYTWSSGSNFSTAHVTPVSNITYTVSGIDNFGCNLSNMVAVTVNSSPTVVASSNKSSICKNESVSLSAQGANTYTWSNGSIGTPVNLNLGVDVVYTYTVTGEDNNGCMGTSVITVNVNKCTGINEFGTAGLSANVYPNPASSLITVELNNSSAKLIEVIDLTGRIVLSKTGSSEKTEMDVTGLAGGIYYVKLSSENKSEVFKIVKSH